MSAFLNVNEKMSAIYPMTIFYPDTPEDIWANQLEKRNQFQVTRMTREKPVIRNNQYDTCVYGTAPKSYVPVQREIGESVWWVLIVEKDHHKSFFFNQKSDALTYLYEQYVEESFNLIRWLIETGLEDDDATPKDAVENAFQRLAFDGFLKWNGPNLPSKINTYEEVLCQIADVRRFETDININGCYANNFSDYERFYCLAFVELT